MFKKGKEQAEIEPLNQRQAEIESNNNSNKMNKITINE